MEYDYTRLLRDISVLKDNYPFIKTGVIGRSVMQKDIPYIKIGNGDRKIFLGGAYHGLEYITSAFLMRFISRYIVSLMTREKLFGYDIGKLFASVSLYTVPMINPDGVDIAINGLDITDSYHRELISLVGIHSFNKVWQANARGVDLNHNYDANWQPIQTFASPTKYGGKYPESEPETRAVTEFIRREDFDLLLAFHSQGGEIYYDFDGLAADRAYDTAKKMAAESGYFPMQPSGSAAYGGCKDWFIKEFGRCGFTIEMGRGKNPLPVAMLDRIFEENARIILCAADS